MFCSPGLRAVGKPISSDVAHLGLRAVGRTIDRGEVARSGLSEDRRTIPR